MPVCCEKKQTGKFCGECGKSFPEEGPLDRLLAYAEKRMLSYGTQLNDLNQQAADKKKVARLKREMLEWKDRFQALSALMTANMPKVE